MSNLNNIIILTGPTCCGKTAIAVQIMQNMPGIEIISADSMQLYKDMDIGTAKPDEAILQQYKHYGIDMIDPSENYNAMKYSQYAYQCIEKIIAKGRKPIIVGGTGLYIKSLLHPIFEGPGRNQAIRDRLKKKLNEKGSISLFNLLKHYDPTYAGKINSNDTHRIIRALEVYYLTGKPFSAFHDHQQKDSPKTGDYTFYIICLSMDRDALYRRINQRVDLMIKNGLIEETKNLLEKYDFSQSSAMKGLGYKQIINYLQEKITREEAIELIKKETRHFAKRQLSWFKNQLKVNCWILLDENEKLSKYVNQIIDMMKTQGYS